MSPVQLTRGVFFVRRSFLFLAVIGMVAVAGLAPAHAGSDSTTFDWGNAKACAVFSVDDVRCYPSEAAMEATTAKESSSPSSSDSVSTMSTASGYCAGRSDLWLYLYEHSNFGGRVLKFRDTNIWQNLTVWDFNDKTSAWRNDTYCYVDLAEHINGAGLWLTLLPRTSNSYIGDVWNDRVSSLYINY